MRYSFVLLILLSALDLPAQTPVILENGVVNAASQIQAEPVAPGALVAISGRDLTAAAGQPENRPLPLAFNDVSVTFGGVAAPISLVSPSRIQVVVPSILPPGTTEVVITRAGSASAPQSVGVRTHAPGIFSILGRALVANTDSTLAQPAGSLPAMNCRPAVSGEAILIYATGLGPVDPPVVDGADSMDQARQTTTLPKVTIGGESAAVVFSGLSQQFPGVYLITAIVPATAPAGAAVPLQIEIGGAVSTGPAFIAVQK